MINVKHTKFKLSSPIVLSQQWALAISNEVSKGIGPFYASASKKKDRLNERVRGKIPRLSLCTQANPAFVLPNLAFERRLSPASSATTMSAVFDQHRVARIVKEFCLDTTVVGLVLVDDNAAFRESIRTLPAKEPCLYANESVRFNRVRSPLAKSGRGRKGGRTDARRNGPSGDPLLSRLARCLQRAQELEYFYPFLVAERIKTVQEQETSKAQANTEQLKKEIERTRAVQDAQRQKELRTIEMQREVVDDAGETRSTLRPFSPEVWRLRLRRSTSRSRWRSARRSSSASCRTSP